MNIMNIRDHKFQAGGNPQPVVWNAEVQGHTQKFSFVDNLGQTLKFWLKFQTIPKHQIEKGAQYL